MTLQAHTWKKTGSAAVRVILPAAALMLFVHEASSAASGIRDGLRVCGELLIPSVYPMMILCAFFLRCGAADGIGRLLSPLMRLLALPDCAGAVLLTALVGGYPVGARGVQLLRARDRIDDRQAAHLLHFCVCAGPGFIVNAVGAGLFRSRTLGMLLFAVQVVSVLLLGLLSRFIMRLRPPVRHSPAHAAAEPICDALVDAVTDASASMIALCAFVLAFSGLLAALSQLTLFRAGVPALLLHLLPEVTAAVQTAAVLHSPVLAAFALGWGGLCVHGQIRVLSGVRGGEFLPFRLLHGLLAAGLTALLLRLLPHSLDTALPVSASPQLAATAANGGYSAALLLLVAVFLLSMPQGRGVRPIPAKTSKKIRKKHSAARENML